MTFQPRTRRAVRCLSALTLAGILGLSGAAPYITLQPVSAFADPQSELDAAKAKLAEIGAEYQALQTELQQAGAQLEETASQIADTQTELESAQALLSENVSSDYKKGSVSLIDILLSSQDFTDLISRVFYVSKVNDAQTNAIESVKELQVQLQQQQTEQQQALSDTQAKVDAQAENQARAAAVVDSLSAEVQAQIEAEAQEDENLAAGMQSAQDASNGASQVPVTGNQSTSNNGGSTSGNNNQESGNQSSNNNQSTNNQGGNQNQNQPSGGGQNTTPAPAPEPEPEPSPRPPLRAVAPPRSRRLLVTHSRWPASPMSAVARALPRAALTALALSTTPIRRSASRCRAPQVVSTPISATTPVASLQT